MITFLTCLTLSVRSHDIVLYFFNITIIYHRWSTVSLVSLRNVCGSDSNFPLFHLIRCSVAFLFCLSLLSSRPWLRFGNKLWSSSSKLSAACPSSLKRLSSEYIEEVVTDSWTFFSSRLKAEQFQAMKVRGLCSLSISSSLTLSWPSIRPSPRPWLRNGNWPMRSYYTHRRSRHILIISMRET